MPWMVLHTMEFINVLNGNFHSSYHNPKGCRDPMVVGFRTACAISAYHHESCELESCSW
jgi:hypothetical protein